ncbi:hypothetical protein BU26DRAFT_130932 [Trematosphaeria pertusa]|uniref:Uncharacterized protein n=1 Tax=Trematosphaeria pertusa TaxID=390896 RepID=A0A6A6HY34_9PLEO|nr:uncharacterized protein BU26DRAFT_130932 [Trematosphaeria pertusa]KAF2242698.1 hypothetical protein BU26DRAFT_130932 [Trematosphaeria pertusa]
MCLCFVTDWCDKAMWCVYIWMVQCCSPGKEEALSPGVSAIFETDRSAVVACSRGRRESLNIERIPLHSEEQRFKASSTQTKSVSSQRHNTRDKNRGRTNQKRRREEENEHPTGRPLHISPRRGRARAGACKKGSFSLVVLLRFCGSSLSCGLRFGATAPVETSLYIKSIG